ncbi:sensor histidine kinase [Streptomyces sp. cg28]|uniref:sensor histidine kinase n=1 Tax=Streptomyces sp. cg28 TaxID=3403457 RepID=UPI003B2166C4
MSDSALHPRPAANGHRRRRAPQLDAVAFGHVRRAVIIPLLLLTTLMGTAAIVWLTVETARGWALAALIGGLGVIALVADRGARHAAGALHAAAGERRAAELAAVTGDVAAVEKVVVWSADELCRGARPPLPAQRVPTQTDAAAQIGRALGEMQLATVTALIRVHDESQSVVLLQVLRRLAMREHSLVSKALTALNQLEKLTDDPELLDKIFQIDHLVTRMRRQVESTAVLGGQSLRSTRQPVSVTTTLRGAVSEVVQYPRVVVAAGSVGVQLGLPGHVGPDFTHLLAELIENACECSDPATRVLVRAERVPNGLVIEIEDRAIPMTPQARARMNHLLQAPDEVEVGAQVRAGQLGLLVAAKIAQTHNLTVHLQENQLGGTTAQVVIPTRLLVAITPRGDVSAPPHTARPVGPPPGQAAAVLPQEARPAGHQPVPVPGTGGGPGLTTPEPALPRRPRRTSSDRPPQRREDIPAVAPTPGLAGAFRHGVQAGEEAHASRDSGETTSP